MIALAFAFLVAPQAGAETHLLMSRVAAPTRAEIEASATGATVKEIAANGGAFELAWSKPAGLKLTITRLDSHEVESLRKELQVQVGQALVPVKAPATMNAVTYDTFERLIHTRHALAFSPIPPGAAGEPARAFVARLAKLQHGLLATAGRVADPGGRLLFEPGKKPDPKAALPWFESAVKRRARTRERLAKEGIAIPDSLPPSFSDEEFELRPLDEVARRGDALLIIVSYAHGASHEELEQEMPRALLETVFTPDELRFYVDDDAEEATKLDFAWRIAAFEVIDWATGSRLEVPLPLDVEPEAPTVADESAPEPDAHDPVLRPLAEILDGADRAWCVRWASAEGTRAGERAALLIDAATREHLRAFRWLIRHRNLDWDDVVTDS